MSKLTAIRTEFRLWTAALFASCPGNIGSKARAWLFRREGGRGGHNLYIDKGARIRGCDSMEIGDDVVISQGCIVEAVNGKLTIGNRCAMNFYTVVVANGGTVHISDNVIIGMGTVIRAANHGIQDTPNIPIRDQAHIAGEVVIEEDVWIGANVVILPNATIGRHSVIAAGAVVTKDIPPFSISAGVPARIIGNTRQPKS